ncbi:MAG: GH92 family glycosyl hydrolase [Deltaproteobacteria bacterium]|nr:GH92 family glycosyl hydrolase [Deltaproteobacteria bacterium]
MRWTLLALSSMLAACGPAADGDDGLIPLDPAPPADYVDTAIGTGGHYFGYGSAFAGACAPFGMAKPGPDTTTVYGAAEFHHFSGYHAEDDLIEGFSSVHISGTGASDYGALLLMPSCGFDASKTTESGYRAAFLKREEQTRPGYYRVRLADSGIVAELTASARCAVHRYTYAAAEIEPAVVLDLSHAIPGCEVSEARLEVSEDGSEWTGHLRYHGSLTGRSGGVVLYFAARTPRPASWQLWQERELAPGARSAAGRDLGAGIVFPAGSESIEIQLGLSYVDAEGARANLEAEIGSAGFDEVRARAEADWDELLGRVRIAGGTASERKRFYTALYHACLTPTTFSDADGRYTGFDLQVHEAHDFVYYTDFSMWDTYRCLHPLLVLLAPERQRDMLRSLLAMLADGGDLPKWPAGTGYTGCMIGTPADVVFADSFLKGVQDFDVETALDAVIRHATEPAEHAGRAGVARYLELGYVPADEVGGAAARTLEFGVADAAIAAWLDAMGRGEQADAFRQRARGYRWLYDPEVGFLRGRNADGTWSTEPGEDAFNPLDWQPYYTEGSAWQYLWLAPQDPQGLAELLGGAQAAADKLETFFSTPEPESDLSEFLPDVYYWHGNEPDLHAAYLFVDFGRPDRAQAWLRHVMETRYGDGPDGLDGNDDCGTLSAWYVFSASGLYPNAGQVEYWIGSPLFERVVFDLGAGLELEIRALGASEARKYVRSASLDGQALEGARIDHAALRSGRILELDMSAEPSDWGATP